MRLAAIYNVWDGEELLEGSIEHIKDHVDEIIIVYQNVSNFGEQHSPFEHLPEFLMGLNKRLTIEYYDPHITGAQMDGTYNELEKRKRGLHIAKQNNCTHFILMDCDEYYPDFELMKAEYIKSEREEGCDGSYCHIITYFKKPEYVLKTELIYLVPFIHPLKMGTQLGYKGYPIPADETRTVRVNRIKKMSYPMHHYAYVRENIERKLRNSSARMRRDNDLILKYYKSIPNNLQPGMSYPVDCFRGFVEVKE